MEIRRKANRREPDIRARVKGSARSLHPPLARSDPGVIMKATVVRALAAAAALALALAVGYSVQPAGAAAPATAPDCVAQLSPSAPTAATPMARGHLVAV